VIESTGEVVTFPSFIAFVTSARPAGLDVEVKALKRLCQDDTEAFDLIDAADQNPTGVHNIHTTRPSGTSEQAALRRLRKDRPDLHEQVIAHGMSAHAAMVSAGYRPKTVTVRTDPSAFARAARKHLTDDQIEELVEMLESDE
jgi:hypothetical protein